MVPGALALLSVGGGGAGGATIAVSSPAALIGALYLWAAWLDRRPTTQAEPGDAATP